MSSATGRWSKSLSSLWTQVLSISIYLYLSKTLPVKSFDTPSHAFFSTFTTLNLSQLFFSIDKVSVLFYTFFFPHNSICVYTYVGLMPSMRNSNVNNHENKGEDIIVLGCSQTFDWWSVTTNCRLTEWISSYGQEYMVSPEATTEETVPGPPRPCLDIV